MKPAWSTVAALVLLLAATVHAAAPKTLLEEVGVDQHLNQRLPLGARFLDEHGQPVALGDYFGKRPVILVLGYYHCPNLCGSVWLGLQATLRQIRLAAGRDYQVVAVSIDPRERPADARAWKKSHLPAAWKPRSEGWTLLTGAAGAIQKVAHAAGFRYVHDDERDQYAHVAVLVVATPSGRISRYLFGIQYGAADLRLALVEASRSAIGSVADRLLLLCYHYDPATGRYDLMVSRILQAGGLATVLALGGGFLVLRRHERASRPRSRQRP